MRWTRQRFARDGIAGRVGERPVSGQQRADEGCCSVRRSRVVLTPRRWRQVRGVKSAQPGLDKTYPLGDGGKRARSPRARRKPLKPLRAGTAGDSGVLVVTRVRSTNTKCTRGRGCHGHPAFPTPSLGGRFINGSGALRREVAKPYLELASLRAQRSNPFFLFVAAMGCFVASLLAMTFPNRTSFSKTELNRLARIRHRGGEAAVD